MTFQTSPRRRTGAPHITSPLSLVSLARDSYPDELPPDEPFVRVRDTAGAAPIIAQALLKAANLRGADALRRVLVVEPRTRNIGVALRTQHYSGLTAALMRMPLPREFGVEQGYDQIITEDWLPSTNTGSLRMPTTAHAHAVERLGTFDAVIVSDLTRTLSPHLLTGTLAWLTTCVNMQGFLVLAEPAHTINVHQLARDLLESGLELVTDPEYIADDWPRSLLVWRRRSPSEAQRSGVVQRIGWEQLAVDRPLQRQLISAYQYIFGGDEWREWVKCMRPGCGRHYSRAEALALDPPDRCVCGWNQSLAPYHPAQDVLARLYQDLTPAETSCAYFRFGDVDVEGMEREVGGFAWGYLTDPYRLARTLLPVTPKDQFSEKRLGLARALHTLLHRAPRTGGRDNPPVIYYHADSGVVEQTRSLSLTRYLFERSLQFALEQGAETVILRTSLRSPAYRLLTGLGMRPMFWYSGEPRTEPQRAARPGDAQVRAGAAGASPEIDERVVLWGEVSALLNIFSTHSDFRLAGRIARGLRAVRDESELS